MSDQSTSIAAINRLLDTIETAIADPSPTTPDRPATTSPNPLPSPSLANFLALGRQPQKPRVTMPEDPGLPTNLLPPHLEEWMTTMARQTSVPTAMVTIPFLAATGGVIGNRLALQLQAGWTEYPTLWVALVALTGTRKTPALGAARLPFDLLHDELQIAWAATKSPDPAVPLITPEATWERLQQTLEPARGLILYRDELVGLLRAIDGHRGEDRQRYLSLWTGDPLHQKGRPSIYHPVVSIIGGIQPLLLHRLRNKQPDGLLDRFIPILAGGGAIHFDRTLSRTLPPVEPVLTTLRILHQQPNAIVTLSPAAEDLWTIWHDTQVELTYTSPSVVGGFYRKYPSHLARFALVLHALWHPHDPSQPLSRDTMDRAITLMEYLRIHLHRSIFFINEQHPVLSPAEQMTNRILEILASHHPHWLDHFKLACQLGRPPSAMFNAALDMLSSQGEIESRTHKHEGRGRPARQYRYTRATEVRHSERSEESLREAHRAQLDLGGLGQDR